MAGINNLKPERVVKTFERAGWTVARRHGSHILLHREHEREFIIVPDHEGRPVKKGLLLAQIKRAGMTEADFLRLYK